MKAEPTLSPNIKQTVPFFGVLNMEESLRYYTDGLGFKMTDQWIDEGEIRWCFLERDGAALMLQEFGRDGHQANAPLETLGEGVCICFICADALALYREFRARGIMAAKPFVGNGMWVTSLRDPNGYRLDFESFTDAPEESEYDENED